MKSYQLFISLSQDIRIQIGKKGLCRFKKGIYVYTGSAKKNMDARIATHKSIKKSLHWHIDYLLANPKTHIIKVRQSNSEECNLNQHVDGVTLVPGFGSSDCKKNCSSHLNYLSSTKLYKY